MGRGRQSPAAVWLLAHLIPPRNSHSPLGHILRRMLWFKSGHQPTSGWIAKLPKRQCPPKDGAPRPAKGCPEGKILGAFRLVPRSCVSCVCFYLGFDSIEELKSLFFDRENLIFGQNFFQKSFLIARIYFHTHIPPLSHPTFWVDGAFGSFGT